MRILAVVNHKGGSGKTTTAVNLAAALGERGRRVLLVDLDGQGSATSWLRGEPRGRGIFDSLLDGRPLSELAAATNAPGVDLVAATDWLAAAERVLEGEERAELLLRRSLSDLHGWDDVLLDCPPALGVLTVSALAAAREVLVPVEAHVLALEGLVQVLRSVDLVQQRMNPALAIAAILACRVNRTRHTADVVEELRRRFGPLVLTTVVRENIRLAECPSFGKPIMLYAPESAGAADYRAVAAELVERAGSAQIGGRGAS